MEKINPNNNNGQISRQKMNENSKYENFRAVYFDYVRKIEKSDFANSLSRWQVEHNMLKSMYELALKENKKDEARAIEKRYSIVSSKFKQFGIVLKDLHETEKQD